MTDETFCDDTDVLLVLPHVVTTHQSSLPYHWDYRHEPAKNIMFEKQLLSGIMEVEI